ncbi:hypothetical protein [Nocardia pseudovaccinii]|uniref:hypothetical protein n=1 Tax=Nocardia pseudovaccinii TaxID=189540 RepID=UPI0007A4B13A|nr:hypothetical protein [Nocardia pseudovaccinii]
MHEHLDKAADLGWILVDATNASATHTIPGRPNTVPRAAVTVLILGSLAAYIMLAIARRPATVHVAVDETGRRTIRYHSGLRWPWR